MKILIIGGIRFLGYHLTKRLIQDGYEVTLFNRCQTPDDFGSRVAPPENFRPLSPLAFQGILYCNVSAMSG
jgi:nucleoside-diphosphate-sugar epimerase